MRINKSDLKSLLKDIEKKEEDMRWYNTSPYKLIEDIKKEIKYLIEK